jgi:hypothetical protein
MLFVKHFLLILFIITLTVASASKTEMIYAQTASSELKQLLKQADSLAINSKNDNFKDKDYSPPSDTMGLLDICHKQTENNPSISNPDRFCFNTIINKCQKNNLSVPECYASNFVSFKAEDIDIAVLNSANAKLNK